LRVFVETANCGLTLNRSSYAAVAANLFIDDLSSETARSKPLYCSYDYL